VEVTGLPTVSSRARVTHATVGSREKKNLFPFVVCVISTGNYYCQYVYSRYYPRFFLPSVFNIEAFLTDEKKRPRITPAVTRRKNVFWYNRNLKKKKALVTMKLNTFLVALENLPKGKREKRLSLFFFLFFKYLRRLWRFLFHFRKKKIILIERGGQ
jgi:hypothetical protein